MQKGQTALFILVGILVIAGIAGGTYYLGTLKSKPQASSPNPSLTSQINSDLCSIEGDTILAVATNFENLQRNRDAKGVLKLFTKPQSQNDIDDYNNLSGEDMHIEPRLYSNVSTSSKILSYKIIKQPTKYNNSCEVEVEEERSYYGGPTNPQYLPAKNEGFNLTLIKQSDGSWMIDQYQSQDPKIRNGKYSGWLMEIANPNETANWKTYTQPLVKFSIKYPPNLFTANFYDIDPNSPQNLAYKNTPYFLQYMNEKYIKKGFDNTGELSVGRLEPMDQVLKNIKGYSGIFLTVYYFGNKNIDDLKNYFKEPNQKLALVSINGKQSLVVEYQAGPPRSDIRAYYFIIGNDVLSIVTALWTTEDSAKDKERVFALLNQVASTIEF